ncbi:MAG: MBL fold metallo-hydrolase [Myxococcales bacterium]|nr:MBL fold metallo-hydrolase [Myxococcales bacterium]
MITRISVGGLTLRGVSLGGVYTSIFCPELNALFDVGISPRSSAAADFLFVSHGHVDHVGALSSHLGIRALVGKQRPPKIFLPQEIEEPIKHALEAMTVLQRYELAIDAIPMKPGETVPMRGDLHVRAFQTHHVVPSLGYSLARKIKKLKDEFKGLPGFEIAEMKRAGRDLFNCIERTELSYCTDTLIQALDNNPELYKSRVLVLECTFLDERKPIKLARAGCHIHLDEIIERAERFENEALVLMHFSQLYKPAEVVSILDKRCPAQLRERIIPFVPGTKGWPG